MTRSVFVTSAEPATGKSTVAFGLLDTLSRTAGKIGVFRPVYAPGKSDRNLDLMLSHEAVVNNREDALGVTYEDVHANSDQALNDIVEAYQHLAQTVDFVLILGGDFLDISAGGEAVVNARVAANLGAPVVLVVHGNNRSAAETARVAAIGCEILRDNHAVPVALVVNRATVVNVLEYKYEFDRLPETESVPLVGVFPEMPLLAAPTIQALADASDSKLLQGSAEWMKRASRGFLIAAMTLPNVLQHLTKDVTVIVPGDRYDVLPGLLLAHQSGTFPSLAGVILTGGYEPPETVERLVAGLSWDLPVMSTNLDTFATTTRLANVRSGLSADSPVKQQTALRIWREVMDVEALISAVDAGEETGVVTPIMFSRRLIDVAREQKRHIVLPEGGDLRILSAADDVLRQGIAHLTILGDENTVRGLATSNGLDIRSAKIVSPHDEHLVADFAQEYARLRAHKGISLEQAREQVQDVSYFGTMMVHSGLADGMVSGAAHTTAHTIKPSFEIIKTAPDAHIVSSVFLMLLEDQVLVYGDCAVNPHPSAEELADIAVQSARTGAKFGIAPRVAMLSYSTGDSGAGADVELVRKATSLVHQQAPDLLVDGPMQYDAAVDPAVAATKMPGSPVAGQASVLIFPDLNTGNNTYKAVQRSAGAIAIGPVLQGLNRPVNDLSRGSTVDDIINTIIITAAQA